jgi:tetratricopeptide (TPR) repeat protein
MFSYPWIARGELMLATRQSTAEYCFDKAIQVDSDWLVQMEIASVYLHYGRPARALPLLRIAADRAGDYPDPWYQQGRCELAMGLITSAEKSFAHCLQILPNHADCRRELLSLSMNRRSVRRWFRRTFFRR